MNQPEKPKEGAVTFEDIMTDFKFDMPTKEVEEKPEVPSELTFEKETEEEVEKAEDIKPEKEEVKQELPKKEEETTFYKLTKKLIEEGKWSDANIEDEDGNSVKLSEYKNLTQEEYLDILEKQKEFEKEEIELKYIKTDGADETKKRIANIVLNGGDLKEIFRDESEMSRPFTSESGWDLDNETHQASIVYQHFLSQGMSKKQAESLVKAAQEDLNLDTQAQQIVEFYQKNFDDNLKKAEADVIAEKESERERLKTYKSELSKIYKEQKLPETLTKKLVDLATKENTDGELLIDELYNKVMQDPKEAQEVILFLADRKAYMESRMYETKKATQTESFRTISLIPRDKVKKAQKEEETTGDLIFEIPPLKQ
jgi:hypothetical protein